MNIVGNLHWDCCFDCKHYRPGIGGCAPLDEGGESILRIDLELDTVECDRRESEEN
jgi:hypothetical protein